MHPRNLNALTVVTGAVLGAMVALTSIGAGALGTVALFILTRSSPRGAWSAPRSPTPYP